MKIKFLSILAIAATLFASCSSDDDNDKARGAGTSYVINYGGFSGAKSSISIYDNENDVLTNGHYEAVNNVSIVSNVQYAYNHDGNIYMMGNNTDQVFG